MDEPFRDFRFENGEVATGLLGVTIPEGSDPAVLREKRLLEIERRILKIEGFLEGLRKSWG